MLTSPDGTTLWAESAGDASKPAIVFVHGLSCTALGWDAQFADTELQRSFHLVRYEMRGHGRSSKPLEERDYESARIAEDFRTVCEAFGLVKPFMAGWYVLSRSGRRPGALYCKDGKLTVISEL